MCCGLDNNTAKQQQNNQTSTKDANVVGNQILQAQNRKQQILNQAIQQQNIIQQEIPTQAVTRKFYR